MKSQKAVDMVCMMIFMLLSLLVAASMAFAADLYGVDIGALCMLFGLTPQQTAVVAAIFAALFAISEALALIPAVKANSLFQLLYGLLKKVAGKGTAAILIFCITLGLLAGCATAQNAQPYEIGKVTAEAILYEARVMQNAGKLSDADFQKIKRSYDQYRACQNIVIDTRLSLLKSYNADVKLQYDAALKNLPIMLKDLMDVAAAFNINLGFGGVQ